jgi:hypothetical protein
VRIEFTFPAPAAPPSVPPTAAADGGPGAGGAGVASCPSATTVLSLVRDLAAPAPVEAVDDTPFSFAYTGRHDGGPLPPTPAAQNAFYGHLLSALDVRGLLGCGCLGWVRMLVLGVGVRSSPTTWIGPRCIGPGAPCSFHSSLCMACVRVHLGTFECVLCVHLTGGKGPGAGGHRARSKVMRRPCFAHPSQALTLPSALQCCLR